MNTRTRFLLALVLIVVATYLAQTRFPSPPEQPGLNGFYKVMQVNDGDTIVILQNGKRVSVRLIGIDSPEVETPYTKEECFGKDASSEAHRLLDGKMVRIEVDPTQDLYDKYQRLLAYVYIPTETAPGGILVNKYFVEEGFAREYTFRDAYTYKPDFVAAQSSAKEQKKGLWGACLPAQAGIGS